MDAIFKIVKTRLNSKVDYTDFISALGIALSAIGWVFSPLILLPIILLILSNNNILYEVSKTIIVLIDSLSFHIGEVVKWLLPLLVLSVAFTVFALSIFGQSWTKLSESSEYFHSAVIMLGAGATLLVGQHVRVDVFHTNMSPKGRALVDFIGYYALLLPVCLIILWNSQSTVYSSWRILEGSPEADGIRGEFLIKTLIPIFAVMMIMQAMAIALRAAMRLTDRTEPPRPAHTPDHFVDEPRTTSDVSI